MFKKVIRDASVLGAGTLISRVLGFIRDILLAYFFGTSYILEAFLVAFRLPNLFRSIFAEGFADTIAIPILAEEKDNKSRVFDIGSKLISLFILVLGVAVILGVIFSKYLVLVMAPGFLSQPDKFTITVSFTRITFIYLLLIGISVNLTALLCALKKFFVFSVNPALLNISFIIGVIFFSRFFKNYILVICVLAAGILQIVFPYIVLKRIGFSLRFNFKESFRDKAVIRMLKLFPPRACSSITYHISVILDTVFCSFSSIVGQGALAALYFANRFIQFPFALIALSISSATVVDLSYLHKQEKIGDFKKLLVFSLQNIIFFIIPISAIFIFIPHAIIDTIFRRGEFSAQSAIMTSSVLFFYAFGLFSFCVIKLLVNAFYALKDTATPAKATVVCLFINAILSFIFMFPLKVGGVALGSSLAAAGNVFFLYRALIKKIGRIDWQDTKNQFIKVFILSLITAAVSRFLWQGLFYSKYLKMLIVMTISFGIFFAGGYILGLKQIKYVTRRLGIVKSFFIYLTKIKNKK